jgi:RNA polymerase sigma-70 factor (ECF subfamily)
MLGPGALPLPISPIPKSPQEEEALLAARIAHGDEEALQELHRRYAPLVFHLACKTLDRAAAEEITQEVFLAVWRKAGSHDPERGAVKTWLLSIAHHRILDELRARQRRPAGSAPGTVDALDLAAQDPLPDEALWREYQRQAIAEALAALPEPQRRALQLAFFADLTQEKVAEALHVPLGTVKTRIRSGLRSLFGRLGGLVAGFLLLLGLPGLLYLRQETLARRRAARALDLLANSQLRILKLLPPGLATLEETTPHAAFRGLPGRDLAVLTLSHFPAAPAGQHYVLWLRGAAGLAAWKLPEPDREGKAMQLLEGPPLAAWPTGLEITLETGAPRQAPTGPVMARWPAPAQGQPPGPPPPPPA